MDLKPNSVTACAKLYKQHDTELHSLLFPVASTQPEFPPCPRLCQEHVTLRDALGHMHSTEDAKLAPREMTVLLRYCDIRP